jgi:hypothetical protein
MVLPPLDFESGEPTGIKFIYTYSFGLNMPPDTEEGYISGSGGGLNLLWLKYYISQRFAIDISSHCSFYEDNLIVVDISTALLGYAPPDGYQRDKGFGKRFTRQY